MGRVIKIELSDQLRKELANGYRKGKSHAFRTRCQLDFIQFRRLIFENRTPSE